jgi:LysR family transcriptional regulator, glycine cleavage system transcriptional activator
MPPQRIPRLSLDLLRGFHAAARHLSFTKAANDLFVTQSAISQEVKALEEQLGNPLFTRVNRTLRLTHAGEQLYRAVDEALSLIDSAAAQVAGTGEPLSITMTVPFATLWLGPRLPAFARLYPGISLRVAASNDNLDVERENIDIAIRYVPSGAAPPSQETICEYEMFPVCSPALNKSSPITSPSDLSRHVLLDFETLRRGRPWYDWQLWLHAKQIRGLKPAGSLRFSHYDLAVEAAIAGSGVAIGKWPYLARHLQKGVLVAPLGNSGVATLGSFYVVVRNAAPRSAVSSFVTWLRTEVQKDLTLRDRGVRPERRSPRTGRTTKQRT